LSKKRLKIPDVQWYDSRLEIKVSGGYTEGATPVPIPNTEVKPFWADDTLIAKVMGK
jgi:hypothetical protein